ncbi:MAG: T9SS type A sorting domain-containing protein [Bacteroidetes bacterium]|nr:T9SS type A sorting domain-containing protein [Bacteroidota bacterium]HET6245006.1 T9SS type A sorting domain-containing protein [Bacteroidia bacterium]
MKNKLFLYLSIFSMAVILTSISYYYTSFYQPQQNAKAKIEKFSRPAEHFFLQRSYPDTFFDIKAYEVVLKQEQIRYATSRSSSRSINSEWTLEGPGNIGGRINSVAVHPTNSNIIYAGNAGGGIFKTTNGGTTWFPIFDDQAYLSIGCLTIDPNDPNTIYAGTGDPNISGYPAIGDGIYKSTDAGASWNHIGLTDQRIVSKIIIDPSNSNTIYAATMGLPFAPNSDRGLYKSNDGGITWNQILFISSDAGIIDLIMDPFNSQTIYAAGWNRIRNNQQSIVSGQAAKIYKSMDGGVNWNILEGGLPTDNMSRIGMCHSQVNPNTLFAVYVDASTLDLQGIYKTTNGGVTWTALPNSSLPSGVYSGFGWYFGQIRVNPTNDNELFLLSVDLYKTNDGGNNWYMAGPPWWDYTVHADKHDLVYINSSTFILATDGGLYKSTDGGMNFTDIENIPNTQFYRVAVNPHDNAMYYGGAQDQGTMSGNGAAINSWNRMFGGDGFQALFDPNDSYTWYVETQNGGIYYTDNNGNFYDNLDYGLNSSDRRSWDMPYIMSKSNSSILYTGTYRIYKMTGAPYGEWIPISNDLTDGIIFGSRFHVITTVDESAVNNQHLYTGTSDGNVWRTLNGGGSWVNITGSLPDRYVTDIKSSPNNLNTVFVAHSGYKSNDYIPHIHKSSNNGTSWTDISGDLPQLAVNDILILPGHNDSVVFVATDGGVYATLNNGINWDRIGSNMPIFPVYDIDYNSTTKKIIAGTFARSLMTFPMDSIISQGLITVNEVNSNSPVSSSVYPSPAIATLVLEIKGIQSGESVSISIFSMDGRPLKTINSQYSSKTVINIGDLNPGAYIIKSDVGGKTFINRFVKTSR